MKIYFMPKSLKYTLIIIGSLLFLGYVYYLLPFVVNAAPLSQIFRSLISETDNTYYIGTSSPTNYWANIYTRGLTVSDATATTTIGFGTSTFANGISLTSGCFLVGGACVTGGGVTGSGAANRLAFWDGASSITSDTDFTVNGTSGNLFTTAASTTLLSVFNTAYFGATATSSFSSAGALTL